MNESRQRRSKRRASRRRRVVRLALLGGALIIVGLTAWVGIRGFLAQGELQKAVPLASNLKSQVVSGDTEAAISSAKSLREHADAASDLTSDPIWRSFEYVPWLGGNLRVVRELSEVVDHVATDAVEPVVSLAGAISLSDFKPVNGSINLQPIADAQPKLALASSALQAAAGEAQEIDTQGTLQPLVDAKSRLQDMLDEADESVGALDNAAQLLPAMLGANGPRNYLVLFQNNAELRSTGGIPGAMALIQTNGGSFQLSSQASSNDFEQFASPVLELPTETRALYGDHTAEFIQDINFTPQFELTGQIAREMWNRRFGVEIDGVISLDPIALSYLLKATGPVILPSGDELNADNAVTLLLQDVYARYDKGSEQDAFFAAASAQVFGEISSGDVDPKKLIAGLAEAGSERRILMWSNHPEDQEVLAKTSLSGSLPVSTDDVQKFGVYFNDATAAKMDPYLDVSIETAHKVCRADGLQNYSVKVTLANNAPTDSASSLPLYVTGSGSSGVPVGSIRTNISVYGAPGTFNLGVLRDGLPAEYHPASDSGYTLSKLQVELAPGQTTSLEFQFLAGDAQKRTVAVEHTPLVYSLETKNVEFSCESALQ